ncbi:unnamed protein product, partial [Amoebophrya sp. A120]
ELDDLAQENERMQNIIRQLVEQSHVVRRAKEREVIKFFQLDDLTGDADSAFFDQDLVEAMLFGSSFPAGEDDDEVEQEVFGEHAEKTTGSEDVVA